MSHAKQLHHRRYLNDYLEIIKREGLPVTDCNRNQPGLQSARFPDHIKCLYRPAQDRIICH
jgi:hypothetical protein